MLETECTGVHAGLAWAILSATPPLGYQLFRKNPCDNLSHPTPGDNMAAKNPAQRRKIRALEAARDSLSEKKKTIEEKLKVTRTQLKHARDTR